MAMGLGIDTGAKKGSIWNEKQAVCGYGSWSIMYSHWSDNRWNSSKYNIGPTDWYFSKPEKLLVPHQLM